MLNKNLILIAVGLVAALLIGISIGVIISVDSTEVSDTKAKIISDLRQKMISKSEKRLLPFIFTTDFQQSSRLKNFLEGELVKIDTQGNKIEVRVDNRYEGGEFFGYLEEPDFYIKTVSIGDETKIIRKERKNEQDFRRETEAYLKGIKEKKSGEMITPPAPFIEKAVSIEDLKIGSKVSVQSETGFNLKENKEITAEKIEIIP